MQSGVGKSQEYQQHLTRLVDGQEAVRLGTEAQQIHIIKRFEEEMCRTPQRKRLYQEAIDRALDDGVELEGSSTDDRPRLMKDVDGKVDLQSVDANVSSSSQATEKVADVVFAREIELAMKLSLEANEQKR